MDNHEVTIRSVDFSTGVISPSYRVLRRTLREIAPIFWDQEAAKSILQAEGDRLIYEVHVTEIPESIEHLPFCTTIIYPGCVGEEYHMTKGHFHSQRQRAEIYLGLSGKGALLIQNEEGEVRMIEMEKGTIGYVPPGWAHRTVNTGEEPFIFFAVYPGDAGHDYKTIEEQGFARRLFKDQHGPRLVESPNWRK
ncbi:MAG: glucose-6-phosphate isomerase family protein [Anaerolineales bacterium]|nr:cupin domain-containing protein [Anaerolineales bacterium]MCS7248371.1 cupin domain-containing protein [Anaerolineales bacterium]MDW8162184.1 glucose-6-phosphate isomerase family protein [Anaerolineales bacterium]MDW8447041.1 glucose-6-phosphate isomerase family protein [Anaerolineales bacterium]